MLPAGAESKHTAIPANACLQTGTPKQEKRKKVAGIHGRSPRLLAGEKKKKRKKQAGLLGGDRITDIHYGFVVLNK